MTPIIFELMILTLAGLSGISVGLAVGIRRPLLLVPFGLLVSVSVRVVTALGLWTFGLNSWLLEFWVGVSIALVALSFPVWRQYFRPGIQAFVTWLGIVAISAIAKYGLQIGEMHHTDSANQFALAIIAIQSDTDDLSAVAASPKLGIAFPLMLALGPGGRILSLFPAVVFLSSLALVAWLVGQLSTDATKKATMTAAVAVGLFSVSVPMFRIAMFYVNSHTLMGLAIASMAAGLVLVRQNPSVSKEAMWLLAIGALVGSTTRIEGILLVGLFILLLASQVASERYSRLAPPVIALTAGLGLSWWMRTTSSSVVSEFGLEAWMLPLITVVGAGLIGIPVVDHIRKWLPHFAAVVLLVLLAREVWASNRPWSTAMAQWPNLVLGEGGWATAAILFVGFTLLLGWRDQTADYRWLQSVVWLATAMIFFSKTFDGSFGRESFYDSVNRMILHVMPLILVVTIVGLSNLLSRGRMCEKESNAKLTTTSA